MAKNKPLTFVLNDETVANCYGFRVLNAQLDLARFQDHPVLLDMHNDWSLKAVIGKWVNIRIEGSQLLADAEFDPEDAHAQEIAGKVKRGYIKACSIGFTYDRDYMVKSEVDGVFELRKGELMEASIVAIGANPKALVRLYAVDSDKPMTAEAVKLTVAKLTTEPFKQTFNTDMEKFQLSTDARQHLFKLGALGDPTDAIQINTAIEKLGAEYVRLQAELEEEKTAHKKLKTKTESQLKASADTRIEQAITLGQLTKGEKDAWVADYQDNPEMVERMLKAIPAKKKLNANGGSDTQLPKTADEFQALDEAAKLAFKQEHPEAYQKLFA